MKVLEHSEAYYEEKVEERLKRVLNLESSSECKLSVEQLEEWVTESKLKKRIKHRRFMAIAASITLMVSALVCVEYFHENNLDTAIAGKNDKQISEESGTVVVKDNDVGVDEHAGARKETITTWKGVLEAQDIDPELLVPGYVPEDWEFEKLEIEENLHDFQAVYNYNTKTENFWISQIMKASQTIVKRENNIIKTEKKKKVFIKQDDNNVATFVVGRNVVEVIGKMPKKNICKIADNIKKGEE